ncbi:MAG TPA: hypothetical protein VF972_00220, partial [Actinomycetota bacterium]
SLMTGTLIGQDDADLAARARRIMAKTGQTGDAGAFLAARRPGEITGTVDQAIATLSRLAEAGVRRVMMQHLAHEDLDFVELVGQAVIPNVTSL